MSNPIPKIPEGILTDEQVAKISGGLLDCSPDDINGILSNLQTNYDTLVQFTSYVIETVANSLTSP
jgi:hypothetical protein